MTNIKQTDGYCSCGCGPLTAIPDENGMGYWDICVTCGKRLANGYHYDDHYDGEDHDTDLDLY